MRIHSQVKLITNSSSSIYTFYQSNVYDNLRSVGNRIINALGIEDLGTGELLKFEDVFAIEKELSPDFLDRAIDDYKLFLPDELCKQLDNLLVFKETELGARFGIDCVERAMVRSPLFDKERFNETEANQVYQLWYQEISATIRDFLISRQDQISDTRSNGDGVDIDNFDYLLIVKATGKELDISSLFYTVFDVEEVYD